MAVTERRPLSLVAKAVTAAAHLHRRTLLADHGKVGVVTAQDELMSTLSGPTGSGRARTAARTWMELVRLRTSPASFSREFQIWPS